MIPEARTTRARRFAAGRWGRSPIVLAALIVAALLAIAGAVVVRAQATPGSVSPSAGGGSAPQTRNITITTVPLLVKEIEGSLGFLSEDFAPGGVLEGKEVYAYSPSTIVVNQGDTLNLTVVNAEDDDHTLTIPDLGVNLILAPEAQTETTIVASEPGIYQFICEIPAHLPYMWGELVVLPAGTAG